MNLSDWLKIPGENLEYYIRSNEVGVKYTINPGQQVSFEEIEKRLELELQKLARISHVDEKVNNLFK